MPHTISNAPLTHFLHAGGAPRAEGIAGASAIALHWCRLTTSSQPASQHCWIDFHASSLCCGADIQLFAASFQFLPAWSIIINTNPRHFFSAPGPKVSSRAEREVVLTCWEVCLTPINQRRPSHNAGLAADHVLVEGKRAPPTTVGGHVRATSAAGPERGSSKDGGRKCRPASRRLLGGRRSSPATSRCTAGFLFVVVVLYGNGAAPAPAPAVAREF